MLYNSISYVLFFLAVVLLYYLIPAKIRNGFLLAASYVFYISWIPQCALLMLFSTLVTFYSAFIISKAKNSMRKAVLVTDIVLNLGILFYFKYINFFLHSISSIVSLTGHVYTPTFIKVLLPVGISFYIFRALSYSIDIYRKKYEPEKNIVNFGLFISFFPLLLVGPIERADHLLPQLRDKHSFNSDDTINGLRLILFGMFKKVAVADVAAIYVDQVFNHLSQYKGMTLILAAFLYTIQIYCDFSGYCDIALGSARVLGFRLTENFKTPYFSGSFSDFWRRWHISLMTWFKDYLYIPLGGNRKGKFRKYLNITAVFLISGLWHGANLTFIVWGALHAVFRLAEEFFKSLIHPIDKKHKFLFATAKGLKIILVFSLVCFAWIFFRANSISDAIYVVKNLFVGNMHYAAIGDSFHLALLGAQITSKTMRVFYTVEIIAGIVLVFIADLMRTVKLKNGDTEKLFGFIHKVPRQVIYFALTVLTVFMYMFVNSTPGQSGPFVYFKF